MVLLCASLFHMLVLFTNSPQPAIFRAIAFPFNLFQLIRSGVVYHRSCPIVCNFPVIFSIPLVFVHCVSVFPHLLSPLMVDASCFFPLTPLVSGPSPGNPFVASNVLLYSIFPLFLLIFRPV